MNKTNEIWNKYHHNLYNFISKRINNNAVAEDILQDIFVKIHSRIDTLKDKTKLESWLYQIMRNAIIDHYRSRKPIIKLPDWITQPQISSEVKIKQQLSSCLAPLIRQLPQKYRLAIKLSEIYGKTQKEVAEKENLTLSGAKSRVQRGRSLLKKMLHDCCNLEINNRDQLVSFESKSNDCKLC